MVPGRERRERNAALVILAFSAGYVYYATCYELGTLTRPGPAMFPLFIGVITMALATVLTVSTFVPGARTQGTRDARGEGAAQVEEPGERGRNLAPLQVAGSIALYGLTAGYLGHAAAATLMVLWVSRAAGKTPWYASIAVTTGAVAVGYLVFQYWLGVPLPKGRLF